MSRAWMARLRGRVPPSGYPAGVSRGARVATVLVNFDQPSDTLAAVEALQAGSYLDNTIIVVDNDANAVAGSPLHEKLDATVGYLPMGTNSGYAAGNNAGARRAIRLHDVDYVWVLNPDTVPARYALAELVAAADDHPDAALMGSRLVDRADRTLYNGAVVEPGTGQTRHLDNGRPLRALAQTRPFDTDYVNGASMLIRTGLIPMIGLIPEDYFLYFEETDYALRCRSMGFRVMVAPASVVRHERRSWGELPTSAYIYYMVRNREIFSARWGYDVDQAHRAATGEFVDGWRARIERTRPDLVASFDELVAAALSNGEAGETGPSDVPAQVKLA